MFKVGVCIASNMRSDILRTIGHGLVRPDALLNVLGMVKSKFHPVFIRSSTASSPSSITTAIFEHFEQSHPRFEHIHLISNTTALRQNKRTFVPLIHKTLAQRRRLSYLTFIFHAFFSHATMQPSLPQRHNHARICAWAAISSIRRWM